MSKLYKIIFVETYHDGAETGVGNILLCSDGNGLTGCFIS